MSLLNPAALWLLLAVPLVFLLPRLRLPRGRRLVANAYLWRRAEAGHPRLAMRVLKQWPLILQAAIVALLAVAAARPVLTVRASNVALVVDVSASMAASSGGRTRFDDAREAARRILAALPRGSRVRVVAAGATARDRGLFDSPSAALRELTAMSPEKGGASIEEAIATARAASGNDVSVHVITDGAAPAAGVRDVRWTNVGTPAENVAIATLAARRIPSSPFDAQLLMQVRNFGSTARSVDARIFQGDTVIGRERLDLAADGTAQLVAAVTAAQAGFRAEIDSPDALAADNSRSATVRQARIPVWLLNAADDFVTAALRANPTLEIRNASLEQVEREAGTNGIVVCNRCERAPATRMGLLTFARGGGTTPAPLELAPVDHPVTAGLVLAGVSGTAAGQAEVPADADVLVRIGSAAAIMAIERRDRRAVTVLVDPDSGTWAFDLAFPLLVANAIDWIAEVHAAAAEPGENVATETESDLRHAGPSASRGAALPTSTRLPREMRTAIVLLIALLAALEWQLAGRHHGGPVALRAAMLLLLLAAAAGLKLPGGRAAVDVVFVLDRSDSVPLREQQRAAAAAAAMSREMRESDRSGLVIAAAEAVVERPLAPRQLDAAVSSTVSGGATNLEAALRVARAALGNSGERRIVLFSDGRETAGQISREATMAAALGIPVDVVPAADAAAVSASVARMSAPAEVPAGEPFPIVLDLTGPPGRKAQVLASRDGRPIGTFDATLDRSGAARLVLEDAVERAAAVTYTAAVATGDGSEPAAEQGAVVIAEAAPAVLHVTSRDTIAAPLAAAGIRVVDVTPASVPQSAAALMQYEAVVLDGVPASDLEPRQSTAIADYVEVLGGGLLVAGDDASLGPAGYPGTSVGEVLPLDLRRRAGSRAPDLSLVVVFDKSGSMADRAGDVTKLELARRSVLSVLDVLAPGDRLGVLAFDTAVQTIAAPGTGHGAADLRARLAAVAPGGSTAIAPALEAAQAALAASAARRQVLLITDGRSPESDSARVMQIARTRRFDLSIVAIGDDADKAFFQRLAAESGGRVFFPADVTRLPEIVAREAARSSGGWHVDEPFVPRPRGAHPLLAGLGPFPKLDGYVVASPRRGAEVVLESHLGDPVLAAWQYGLGRVAAFTARQSAEFRASAVSATLWTQAVRWLGRRGDGLLRVRMTRSDERARIVADARLRDGSFATALKGTAAVRTPSGETALLPLEQRAPGSYEAGAPANEAGTYLASVALSDEAGNARRLLRGFFWPGASERAAGGADRPRLARLAQATGGRLLSPAESPFDAPRPLAWRNVSGWIIAAALALFMSDLIARRGLGVRDLVALARRRRDPQAVLP